MENSTSIVDNRGENTLLARLGEMGAGGQDIAVASAFFSLDALSLMADTLSQYQRVRILFGSDASAIQRKCLLEILRATSDADLLARRESSPLLSSLAAIKPLFEAGKVEARCYTREKFHAKAYVIGRPEVYPNQMGVIGSGNFTRSGLLHNIELNVVLSPEQTGALAQWYEERWAEAVKDVVTDDLLDEIRRQIELYKPWYLYLKALLMWGQDRVGRDVVTDEEFYKLLDEHQSQGFWQALKILERQHGVLICDGVGLGKSYIALALMRRYCQMGKRVLLIAPKNILTNSWDAYLLKHMAEYRAPFGSIEQEAMTWFGFDHEEPPEDKLRVLNSLAERADLIVIDESHNFRTRFANRYENLFDIIKPHLRRRKDIILLTATPINTAYEDLSNQLALITHESGRLAGHSIEAIRKAASQLDKNYVEPNPTGQLTLGLFTTPDARLREVLEEVAIQRSRKTCRELSEAAGRELRFPTRLGPTCLDYMIEDESVGYRELINLAEKRFRPGVQALAKIHKESDLGKIESILREAKKGIKLSAYLLQQYRREPGEIKEVQAEIRLAQLVYVNALKQLESSPAAFQGIIQSIAEGLIGRLKHVCPEPAKAAIVEHESWIRTRIFTEPESEDEPQLLELVDDGENLDISGDESDAWLSMAIQQRGLKKKLAGFNDDGYDVDRWRKDIESDLRYLREVHDAILKARCQPDPKLKQFIPVLTAELAKGNRVLIFTQSQRTAEYLEVELKSRLKGYAIARIDSRVESTRAAILHAFCPGYNPASRAPSVPERVDVLISTDVLSEGVNLQEAGAVFNYDIHWNPVRLIQRIGRVDRRLDPKITPHEHSFTIYNVLPPAEIEKIIRLIGTVEARTLNISKTLGIDQSFFKDTDPANNLLEFNSKYEGEMTLGDKSAARFIRTDKELDERTRQILDQLPPGAFGVWSNAPDDGLFALFTMEATDRADDVTKEKYKAVIGRPVFALELAGKPTLHDAAEILDLLSAIDPDEDSGIPSDEESLARRLKHLKTSVRQTFADISLPGTIMPKLVCWIELRKGNA